MITIDNNKVSATSPEGLTAHMPLAAFLSKACPPPHGTGLIFPDGVKAIIPGAQSFVAIHQTPPRVWALKWVKPDGPLGPAHGRELGPEGYRTVTIALPYVITLAIFDRDVRLLSGYSHCYFTTKPVTDLKDELFLPHLPNVLCNWDKYLKIPTVCTSSIDLKKLAGKTDSLRLKDGLGALLQCLFGAGFNNDGSGGWYKKNYDLDNRLNPVENWEAATAKDPLFVIKDVKWMPSGFTCESAANWINNNYFNNYFKGEPINQARLERVVFNNMELSRDNPDYRDAPVPAPNSSPAILI